MKRFITMILCVFTLLLLVGCETPIKEYRGKEILQLTFKMVDYNGRYTRTYIFDFEGNVVKSRGYLPYEDEEPEFDIIADFSEDEEGKLINKLYSYGLFNINDSYPAPPGIIDGGGWDLTVEYSDGSSKKSSGSNNSPDAVFSNCAKAFYDICGDGIVAYVPEEYYTPPNVSYTLRNGHENNGYSSFGKRLDYRWNGFSSMGNSVFSANEAMDFLQRFYDGEDYTLVLYTANYRDYDRFKKCTVTSYDYNEELTNASVVHSGGWFRQIELNLELNKIYVIRFDFKNGDFVEYTFNTKTAAEN